MIRTLILSLMTLLLSASGSFACSCVGYDTISEYFEADHRDLILIGEVQSVDRINGYKTGDAFRPLQPTHKVKMRVLFLFKGRAEDNIEFFYQEELGGNCGDQFRAGEVRLISPELFTDGTRMTGSCTYPIGYLTSDIFRYRLLGLDVDPLWKRKKRETQRKLELETPK